MVRAAMRILVRKIDDDDFFTCLLERYKSAAEELAEGCYLLGMSNGDKKEKADSEAERFHVVLESCILGEELLS